MYAGSVAGRSRAASIAPSENIPPAQRLGVRNGRGRRGSSASRLSVAGSVASRSSRMSRGSRAPSVAGSTGRPQMTITTEMRKEFTKRMTAKMCKSEIQMIKRYCKKKKKKMNRITARDLKLAGVTNKTKQARIRTIISEVFVEATPTFSRVQSLEYQQDIALPRGLTQPTSPPSDEDGDGGGYMAYRTHLEESALKSPVQEIDMLIGNGDETYPNVPSPDAAEETEKSIIITMSWKGVTEENVKIEKNRMVFQEAIASNFGGISADNVEVIDTARCFEGGCCKIIFRVHFSIRMVEEFASALKYVTHSSFCDGVASKMEMICQRDYNRDLFDAMPQKASGNDMALEFKSAGNCADDHTTTEELNVHCLPLPIMSDSGVMGRAMRVLEQDCTHLKFDTWTVRGPSVAIVLAEPMECCQVLGFQSLFASFLLDMSEDTQYSGEMREHLRTAADQVELIPMSANRVDPAKLTFEECCEWFEKYDTSGDGSLSTRELSAMFQEMNFPGGTQMVVQEFAAGGGVARSVSLGKYEFATWFHALHRGGTPAE